MRDESDMRDEPYILGETYIPDVYVVDGAYAWYWDAKDDLVFAHILTEEGGKRIEWDEPGQVDSRADECSIRLESDIKDILHLLDKAINRHSRAIADM